MFSNAINCMNYQISIDKHLRPDNYVNQHRLQIDIRADKRAPHLKLVAESVLLVMAVFVVDFHPIPHHYFVEALQREEEKNA